MALLSRYLFLISFLFVVMCQRRRMHFYLSLSLLKTLLKCETLAATMMRLWAGGGGVRAAELSSITRDSSWSKGAGWLLDIDRATNMRDDFECNKNRTLT